MAGASAVKTAKLHGFSRATIPRTIKQFTKHGKASSNHRDVHYSLMVTASTKTTMLQYVPLMWLRVAMNSNLNNRAT